MQMDLFRDTGDTTGAGFWDDAEIISSYSRAQAIEDGVLVDLDQGEIGRAAREAGIRHPVAMTASAFGRYVALTPCAEDMGNDIVGRAWDVFYMFVLAVKRAPAGGSDTIQFPFYCVVDRREPERCVLKATIGPGDDAEPVITFMEIDED